MRSRPAVSPGWSPPPAWSSASTWAPSTWSSRWSRPPASPAGSSGSAAPAIRSASRRRAPSSPSTGAICSRLRSSSTECCAARSKRPGSPAIRSMFSPSRSWRCPPWRSGRSRPFRSWSIAPIPSAIWGLALWHGDALGRPVEVGRAMGAAMRELTAMEPDAAVARLQQRSRFDDRAASNLLDYLSDQVQATGTVPTDRAIVIERFRDQLGDWRLSVLTPFGARIHAPWAMAARARMQERLDLEVQMIYTDDGFALRLPEADRAPDIEDLLLDPEEVRELVTAQLHGSALFASRFRENAARALLLPRRRPGERTPLWQQRQRSHDLLQVAGKHPEFPILIETYRECLSDVFDMDGLRDLMSAIRAREVRTVVIDTERASPFASTLVFDYIGQYMYEGDAPLAERRAQALTLDKELLAELLGTEELRELLDPRAIELLELELQGLLKERWPRDTDEAADLLRRLGDLTGLEADARGMRAEWLEQLERERRAIRVRIADEPRWIAAEDAGRYREALGVTLPVGLPDTFLQR